VIVWQSYTNGQDWNIRAQLYNASGAKVFGSEITVNTYTANEQSDPSAAMDDAGKFVVSWSSFGQDQSGAYGVYARQYDASGTARTAGEFLVNKTKLSHQFQSDVACDDSGNFTVVWCSYGQDNPLAYDYGIYARMYLANGSDYLDSLGAAVGEFRVNATVAGNQVTPSVSRNVGNGDYVVAWVGPDSDSTGIFARRLDPVVSTSSMTLTTTIGLYSATAATLYLKNTNEAGAADTTFVYAGASSSWIVLVGDWNGDGADTIGLYDPKTARFYLKDSNTAGAADATFIYGPANVGWTPIVGDWNGDGVDTIGLYDPKTARFYLKNSNAGGAADAAFIYGPANAGWTPIVGDWDGTGTDTIGLYNPTAARFYLRNSNTGGYANVSFAYGAANAGWKPLVGDWDGDGYDTIGLYNPAAARFYLRNSNDGGYANLTFNYGPANLGWTPIVGNWTGSGSALLAAGGKATVSDDALSLTESELDATVSTAIERLAARLNLDAATIDKLQQVTFVIADLSGSYLGDAIGNRIYIDSNAAGYGWFVDPTPTTDEEYAASTSSEKLEAIDSRALDQIDLLTVVEHELGHILGLRDLDASLNDLMSRTLGTGIRRNASYVDAALASS
jgi:hypothetical protein